MDPDTTTIYLKKVEPSSSPPITNKERKTLNSSPSMTNKEKKTLKLKPKPLELYSWLKLHSSDRQPRTAIFTFEPKPKRFRDLLPGDVILDLGKPCRVVQPPGPADEDGIIYLKAWDVFNDKASDMLAGVDEDVTMVATRVSRYSIVCPYSQSPISSSSFIQSFARTGHLKLAAARVPANQLCILKRNVPPAKLVPGTLVLRKQEGRIKENPNRVFEMPGGKVGDSLRRFYNNARRFGMPISESSTLKQCVHVSGLMRYF